MAECGALVAQADLAEFQPERQDPIGIDYRGYTILEAPLNSTGFVLLEELKIAENFDLAAMGRGSADLVHVMVEAKKLAFADRERWGADPRTIQESFGDAPFDELLSTEYTARLAARIDMKRARRPIRSLTPPATRRISASSMAMAMPSPASRASTAPGVPARPPAIPAFYSTTAWPTGIWNQATRTGCAPAAASAIR